MRGRQALGPAPPSGDGTSPRTAGKEGRRWPPGTGAGGDSLAEPTARPLSPGRMKRLCEESSSDTESDGTIDVGREEEYR